MRKQTLTSNAIDFFKLNGDPFKLDLLPGKDQLFTDQKLDHVASTIKDAILNCKFLSIIGEVGSGKSLMKRRVHAELKNSIYTVKLIYPDFFDRKELTVSNIVSEILTELGQQVPRDRNQRYRLVKASLLDKLTKDVRVALILDEAQALNDSVISSLKGFWELYEGAFARLLGVILYGQPSFSERLHNIKFSDIEQRLQIVEMPNFDHSAQNYITQRVEAAGGKLNKMFDSEALKVLCQNATSPLDIGNLANKALNEAAHIKYKVTSDLPMFERLNLTGVVKPTSKANISFIKNQNGGKQQGNGKI
jgi:type II secretory pathway predicted ATPase ExeA